MSLYTDTKNGKVLKYNFKKIKNKHLIPHIKLYTPYKASTITYAQEL